MSLQDNLDTSSKSQADWWKIIKDFPEVFLITSSLEGKQHGRPMHVVSVEENNGMYFFTPLNSPKVEEINYDHDMTLTGQLSSKWVYATGRAEVITDKAKIKELWTEGVRPWFPQGTEDKDVSLICFKPAIGEYWDNSTAANKIKYAFELAKGYLTNQKAEVHGSEWKRVELNNTKA